MVVYIHNNNIPSIVKCRLIAKSPTTHMYSPLSTSVEAMMYKSPFPNTVCLTDSLPMGLERKYQLTDSPMMEVSVTHGICILALDE